MLIFDAHLDLSMNAMEWNRDLRCSLTELNDREKGLIDKPDRGNATITFPEMRTGNVGLCVGTLIARYVKPSSSIPGWFSQEQAWAQVQGQLAWYNAMENHGQLKQITESHSLDQHLKNWVKNPEEPIGYILSLEGADSIISPEHLEKLHSQGLRAIGLSHYGPGVHAFGTDSDGELPQKGKELLRKIEELEIILDVTHLSDTCFYQALDVFNGSVWASHHLCRSITPHNRQLSDHMMKLLLDRNAVIGMALDNWMVVPNWVRGKSTPENLNVTIDKVIDHVSHIAELAGSAKNIMIGSDLDGAFGTEQTPMEIKSIANLQDFIPALQKRGFSASDIEGIMNKNGIDFLRNNLI
jgi:membrane dipeptidase